MFLGDPCSEEFAENFCLEEEPSSLSDAVREIAADWQRPCAFIYAVRVASGIKIGYSGTGQSSSPAQQLSARFTSYRSIGPMQVVGLLPCRLEDAKRVESRLHADLEAFRVLGAGRELFSDCPPVRQHLLRLMRPHWHDDVCLDYRSDLFEPMLAASEQGDPSITFFATDFDEEGEPRKGHFTPVFSWREWIDLRSELQLCSLLFEPECEEQVNWFIEDEELLPEGFVEMEAKPFAAAMLEALLPAADSLVPKSRKKLDRILRGDTAGMTFWWDGALERLGYQCRAT